jgi:outer membrane protein OmpA-like peptidoglycan-associated protein
MTHKEQSVLVRGEALYKSCRPKIENLGRVSFFVLYLFSSSVSAQEMERPVRVGLGAGFGSNISSSFIESFAGSFLCGVYQKGSAPGTSFFGMAEIPFSEKFSLMPSIGYHDISSAFVTNPFTIEHALDLTTHDTIPIYRLRNFSTNVRTISFDALIAFRPFENVHLAAGGGVAYLATHSYNESEKLLTSTVVYRDNNLSVHPVNAGTFNANTILAVIDFAGGYDFALSPKVQFSPQIRASFPITPISTTNGWNYRTWTIGGSVSLMYTIPAAEHETEPLPHPIEIPKLPPIAEVKNVQPAMPRSILRVAVKAVGVTESGEEVQEPVVSIQNVRVTDVAPTLNYLFFDDGSAIIPLRYHSFSSGTEAKTFNPSSLYKSDALGIHYELLNILGTRMQENPNAKITITGTRSLHSPGDSAAASDISLLRAERAAKYLQDVWSIAPSRIRVKSRGLPEQASDENASTGQAENRRVEITTNTPSLLEPVETHRLERIATPPEISFVSNITSDAGIKSEIITIKQSGKVLKTLDALSGSANGELFWNIGEGNMIDGNDSVTWQTDIVDSLGQTARVTGSIRIKKEIQNKTRHVSDTTADKSLERFHLLLFDYSSSAELNSISDEIFDRIASSITPDSRVSLIGHTDVTGDPGYNEHLSYDRASRASTLLSSRLKALGHPAPQFNLEARGAKDILFDNTNAEGRFLSRTVRITVERDLNK